MTETLDQLIQARFDAVANPIDSGDWKDVLARARNGQSIVHEPSIRRMVQRRRVTVRVALAIAVASLAAVVTAVAFGWPQTLIDFFALPPAPTNIKNWFGAQNVTAPPGMNPEAVTGQARKIVTATFDVNSINGDRPTLHTLYVAPRKGGGFCFLWTNADGGCAPAKNPATTAESRTAGPLGVTWSGNDYPLFVDGFVRRTGATQTVEARFSDGTTATIPVTWVSAPINTGFFVYTVPAVHRKRTDTLRSILALDANGNVVGRESFPLTKPLDEDIPQTLPDGTKVPLPRRANAARARKIISFRATDGSQVYLWLIPATGGGYCYLFNQGEGCSPRRFGKGDPAFAGGLFGGTNRILFFGQAKPEVATVELRYQNGAGERLTPVDGFVLHEITPAHYKPGARLVAAVALNSIGKAISTQRFRPQGTGFYPCKKPINRGYGVKTCP